MSMSTPSARRRTTSSTSLSSSRRNRRRCRSPDGRCPGAAAGTGRAGRSRPRARRSLRHASVLRRDRAADVGNASPSRPRSRSSPTRRAGRGRAEPAPAPPSAEAPSRRRPAAEARRRISAPAPNRRHGGRPPPSRQQCRRRRQAAAANQALPAEPPAGQTPAGDSAASVSARRDSDGLRLTFSFAAATPAALFRRADTVWLVFDSRSRSMSSRSAAKGGALIADVSRLPLDKGQAIRIRLNRPQMPSLTGDDQGGARLDAHLCRHDADAAAAAGGDPQHHRSRAGQCHGAAVQARPAAPVHRSGRRRYAAGGHGAAAGPRLHQAAGFRRAVAAGIDPRRGGPSEFRRCHRRDRARQDHPRPARRPDAVVGRRRGRARDHRGAADFRRRASGARTRRKISSRARTR